MQIIIVTDTISLDAVKEIAKEFYDDMIKGVVDIGREIIALGGEYHMDASNVLIEQGSRQDVLWGFNIHFDQPREEWLEYTSLINIRPLQGNTTMKVEDEALREKMKEIINAKIV
jgi:hypothetical protein